MTHPLKTMYTFLVDRRKHELAGWHKEYAAFAADIQQIKAALLEGGDLRDPATYAQTRFKGEDPFEKFIDRLLYDKENGVSSRGQSVLSRDNLHRFLRADGFDRVITKLICEPGLESYRALQTFWEDQKVGNNPVLVNRAIAACDLGVTSTVDEGKFDQVFFWLQKEKLIDQYPDGRHSDWYSKNQYVVSQVRPVLEEVETDPYWISMFFWEIYVNLSNPFSLKKQLVKYGAPGTGKTYQARQLSELQYELWKHSFSELKDYELADLVEVVQFHPSYSYEDFIEGLRPVLDEQKQAQLRLQNGVFKSLCKKAGRWEIDIYGLNPRKKKTWLELTVKDIRDCREQLNGKHWDYIFDIAAPSKKLSEAVPPYFMIIDEINRAELSRVFGELMFCLEYRGVEGRIKTQYAQLNDEETGMLKVGTDYPFFVPHNVYILATMNTIDRSVESFDFALRRRFRWEEVSPDTNLLRYHLQEYNRDQNWTLLADNLEELNEAIAAEPLLGKDYCIGHAYLWNLPYHSKLKIKEVRKKVWEDSIASLLEEYLRGAGRDDLLKTFAKEFGLG